MIDERKEEAAALYALDLLDDAERSEFETDLAADRELSRLVARLRETSTNIALLAPPATPSPLLRNRIMVSVADRSTTPPDHVVPFRLPSWTAWGATACFILATGYFAIANFNTRSAFGTLRESERLARIESQNMRNLLEAERLISRQQITELKLAKNNIDDLRQQTAIADLKITSLASLDDAPPTAQAIAVWNPHTQEGMLSVSKLPALTDGKNYQLWIIDPQYSTPVEGGVFQVDPTSGIASVLFKPKKNIKSVTKFAVSVECKAGMPQTEGPFVLISN